ncbi:MarR family winged helix-turn-helix transcriptional regulator [Microbacterium sp. P06]|uniref:MarR family winged helix-turn-helix transcriptional regulator n=1 Tax=Microbacterium sp. P06 TaxID=3366949 RepID=UPI0037474842
MTTDPAEQIAAALARLRGGRPRPPWSPDGGAHGPWSHGGPHAHGGMSGAPPWAERGRGRFGGPARLRLLEALLAASDPLTVSEAAAAIGVDQPRASRLVQQLADHGLVRREADPADARRTRIALTDAGDALVRGFRGERRDAVSTALSDFTEADRAEFARLLAKFAEAWPR